MTDTPIAFTIEEDGGDPAARRREWRSMLAKATSREKLDGGVAATFPHDVELTAELARLLAAEYACCSFADYHLVIDAGGVRMEIRTPPEAQGMFDGLLEVEVGA